MYTIKIDNECSCVKKSGLENNLTFENKEDALMKAKVLECKMNQEFCFKHYFEAVDMGEEIVIYSTLRPEDEDDGGHDIKELLAKQNVDIHFDAGQTHRH